MPVAGLDARQLETHLPVAGKLRDLPSKHVFMMPFICIMRRKHPQRVVFVLLKTFVSSHHILASQSFKPGPIRVIYSNTITAGTENTLISAWQ